MDTAARMPGKAAFASTVFRVGDHVHQLLNLVAALVRAAAAITAAADARAAETVVLEDQSAGISVSSAACDDASPLPGGRPLASIWDRFLKPSLDVARRTSSSWADSNRPCRCRQLAKPPNVLRRAGIRQLDPTGPWSYSSRSAKSILIVTTGAALPSPLTPGRYRWRCLSSPCAIPRSPG